MNAKRFLCAALSALMMIPAFSPLVVHAVPNIVGPGDRSSVVELNVDALTFDVTVPTSLPVHVSASGEVTTSDDVKIVNNSRGAVTVSNVTLTSREDWTAVDTAKDLANVPIGTKEFSMTINSETTTEAGTITFEQENWPSIYAANDSDTDELPITYTASVAPQTDTVNTDIAEVVFTIGWDLIEPIVITDYYTFTDDPETGGWKVGLTSGFKSALTIEGGMYPLPIENTQQVAYKSWFPGNPLPALPATYQGKPVTNLELMFAYYNPGGGIQISNGYRFGDLDLSNFDTSNVVNMRAMFCDAGCESLILGQWEAAENANISDMFTMNSNLKTLDLSGFDFSDKDVSNIFDQNGLLTTIYVKDATDQQKLQEVYPSKTFEIKS